MDIKEILEKYEKKFKKLMNKLDEERNLGKKEDFEKTKSEFIQLLKEFKQEISKSKGEINEKIGEYIRKLERFAM